MSKKDDVNIAFERFTSALAGCGADIGGLQLTSDWEGTRRRYWVEQVGANVKTDGKDDTEHPFIAPVASLTQRGLIQVAPAPGLPARQAADELHFAASVLEWTAGHQRSS